MNLFRYNDTQIDTDSVKIGYAEGINSGKILYYGKKKIGSLDGDIDACIYPQVSGQTNHIFEGTITCWGKNSSNLINTLTMGFDGANGIIEMRGTTLPPEFGSRLLREVPEILCKNRK